MWTDQRLLLLVLILMICIVANTQLCQQCYQPQQNQKCDQIPQTNISSHTLHMSVHPHLDAFWIYDFETYYSPQANQGGVMGYFRSNRFSSVKQIFDTITNVLKQSKQYRQNVNSHQQKAHRSFFNSQMGFFKRWYLEQSEQKKQIVKQLLNTKYWEIVGGAFVEHDEGCAYYDDIIDNFQMGLHFLKEQFGYSPRAAISADSFGHSQSTLAILAHIGVQGYFVQRSDEHILLQNKTQFIWRAKSANGKYYGALPTHIRWAIHGFEDQFIGGSANEKVCKTKNRYINNLRNQNEFLKRILKSSHIMRYFGHDFQKFDNYSYHVIQGMMEQFSTDKCRKVSAVYGNPTEYFMTMMGEVFNKVKPAVFRDQDIMPIWDYDSGLYWTGYYTTDPFHKKNYRDVGRFIHAVRKAFVPLYSLNPQIPSMKRAYKSLQELAQTNAYLQHHDGISGTSKYNVMDTYQLQGQKKIEQVKKLILNQVFKLQFSQKIKNKVFECSLDGECTIPQKLKNQGDLYLKIFNSGGQIDRDPIIVHLKQNEYYEPDCQYYEINCLCTSFPCSCSLYLFGKFETYTVIKLKKVLNRPKDANLLQQITHTQTSDQFNFNSSHFTISFNNKKYDIGYKRLKGDPTPRRYKHLTRYGTQSERSFSIRSGKYALGSNIKTEVNLSRIRKVFKLQSDYLKKIVVLWARDQMKTVITITNKKMNEWKVQTFSAAKSSQLQDLYLQVSARHISNNKKFYTDSNGWLVMQRQLFKHEDYQAYFSQEGFDDINGNSYPMTAFSYIQDQSNPNNKLSINTDRPQGVTAYSPGTLWVNFDRLSSDDGKWVYQTTYRNQYQKFVHHITVQNNDNNERVIQRQYDEPLLIQGYQVDSSIEVEKQVKDIESKARWSTLTGLENVKFLLKSWNDTTTVLRVHNLHDEKQQDVILSAKGNISPFLTAFYGNTVKYNQVIQASLGGNMEYKQFLQKKWNWHNVVDLTKQNKIFDKTFAQRITLRPLEIRTFIFTGLNVTEQCININELAFNNIREENNINISKPMPVRQDTKNQKTISNYLLKEDHCQVPSPVLGWGEPKGQANLQANHHKISKNNIKLQENRRIDDQSSFSPTPVQPSLPFKNSQQNRPSPQIQSVDPPSIFQDISILISKIKNVQTLTKIQKQKYFNKKLSQIMSKFKSKEVKKN